ncbi:MAG: tRNA(Ile)-lysidine synthase [Pseudomonadota bacterium]|nr:tRNA(Ile)-lysidine synthase [Pseudomonadota bacterium]
MNLLNTHDIATLEAYPCIWVGFSGGMDSLTLLYCLSQIPHLKNRLRAIHVHHGLSPNASHWQTFCERTCQDLEIPLVVEQIKLNGVSNLEEQARNARYQVFSQLLESGEVLLLAHHLDDQIETFFLHALRGSGVDGLACMPKCYAREHYFVIRPFLDHARQDILDYASRHHLVWIEDESNQQTHFSRNFLRQEVLPLIEKKWPHYRQSIGHTIESCQEYRSFFQMNLSQEPLDLVLLRGLEPLERQQYLRAWFRVYHMPLPNRKILKEIEVQMVFPNRQDMQAEIRWQGYRILAYQNKLYCVQEELFVPDDFIWQDFPKPRGNLHVKIADIGVNIQSIDHVEVCYRKGGERIYLKGHHRCVKKLFQEWKVPAFERERIPFIYVNGVLKCIVGYATVQDEGGMYQFELDFYS